MNYNDSDAVFILEKLWGSTFDRVASIVLWNACYHLEVRSGVFRVPSYDKDWHSGIWWNVDQ